MTDAFHTPDEHRRRAQVLLASVRLGRVEGDRVHDGTLIENYGSGDVDDLRDLTTITHLLAALTHAVLAIPERTTS